jgi:hypothetical protein
MLERLVLAMKVGKEVLGRFGQMKNRLKIDDLC